MQIILKRSFWPIDRTLADANTPRLSGTWSNDYERKLHSPPNLQNLSLTIRCNLVPYRGLSFFDGILPLCWGIKSAYSKLCQQGDLTNQKII